MSVQEETWYGDGAGPQQRKGPVASFSGGVAPGRAQLHAG